MSKLFYVTLTSGAQTVLPQIPLPRGEHMENKCGHVSDRLHQVTSFQVQLGLSCQTVNVLTNEILLKIIQQNTFKTKSEATFQSFDN